MGGNWHDKRVWWATSFVACTLISIAERFPRNWSPACGGQVRLRSSIPIVRFRRILSNALCVELRPSMCSFAPRTSHISGLNFNVSLTPAYGGPLACGTARHFV